MKPWERRLSDAALQAQAKESKGGADAERANQAAKERSLPRRRSLADLCWGRTVAVVGSATPEEDLSAKIDACDVVIRFNNFYNMPSGKVGTKTDVVVTTPSGAWYKIKPKQRGIEVIQKQKPLIFAIRYAERLNEPGARQFFYGCEFARDDAALPSTQRFTTGTVALSRLAECAFNCTIFAAGYNPRKEFLEYIETYGKHYHDNARIEAVARDKYLEVVAGKRLWERRTELPFQTVIPARKGSSLKDKNIRKWKNGKPLLAIAAETAKEAFGAPPIVLTDSAEYAELARLAGARVPYIDVDVKGEDNVVEQLRRWRDFSGFYGRILVQQCTTPTTTPETLRKVRDEARSFGDRAGLAAITAVSDPHKVSAYFALDQKTGKAKQLTPGIEPSVPRQKLPETWRFTGAVACVHSDALNADALFRDTEFKLVPVSGAEAVDIDREEDFLNG